MIGYLKNVPISAEIFLNDIVVIKGSSNWEITGKAILEKLEKNKDKGDGGKRIIS